jgi:hypothetical protein
MSSLSLLFLYEFPLPLHSFMNFLEVSYIERVGYVRYYSHGLDGNWDEISLRRVGDVVLRKIGDVGHYSHRLYGNWDRTCSWRAIRYLFRSSPKEIVLQRRNSLEIRKI